MKTITPLFTILCFSLMSHFALGQSKIANIYLGLYGNQGKENLRTVLQEICTTSDKFRIYVSNDQYPILINNLNDFDKFFNNQIRIINPSLPNTDFELDTLLALDSKYEFLSFKKNQPSIKNLVSFHFFIPNEQAKELFTIFIMKYLHISGGGDIIDFDKNVSITIYTKEPIMDDEITYRNHPYNVFFKTY